MRRDTPRPQQGASSAAPKILKILIGTPARAAAGIHAGTHRRPLAGADAVQLSPNSRYLMWPAPEFIGSNDRRHMRVARRGVVNMGEMAAIVMCARNAQPDRFAGVNLWLHGLCLRSRLPRGSPARTPPPSSSWVTARAIVLIPSAGTWACGLADRVALLNFKWNASFPALFFSYTHELVEAMVALDPYHGIGLRR